MSNTAHTPIAPYVAEGLVFETNNHPIRFHEKHIFADGLIMATAKGATKEEAKANAAYIVKAVNCHEELVDLLQSAERALTTLMGSSGTQEGGLFFDLRAALAKAGSQ